MVAQRDPVVVVRDPFLLGWVREHLSLEDPRLEALGPDLRGLAEQTGRLLDLALEDAGPRVVVVGFEEIRVQP